MCALRFIPAPGTPNGGATVRRGLAILTGLLALAGTPQRAEAVPKQVIISDYYDDPSFDEEHYVGTFGHYCSTGSAYSYGHKARYKISYVLECPDAFAISEACYDLGLDAGGFTPEPVDCAAAPSQPW